MPQIVDNNIDPFGNNANTTPSPREATELFLRDNIENTTLTFFRYGGTTSRRRPTLLYSQGVVCSVTDMSPIKGDPLNEKEIKAMGKNTLKVNSGQIFKTSWKLDGDAVHGLAAIAGYDYSNQVDPDYRMLSASTLNLTGDYGVQGAIMIYSGTNARHLRCSEVLTQCRLKVNEIPGSAESYTVEIESTGESMKVSNGQMFVAENFVDKGNGLIVNANAPDGIKVVFKVGNGNESLLGATLPANKGLPLQPVRPNLAPQGIAAASVQKPFYWFVEISVNGKALSPADVVSFNRTTGLLTLAAPPALGSCLSIIYCLPTGKPNFNENTRYFAGTNPDIRMYNGEYYRCVAANGPGVWAAANWQLIPPLTHLVGAKYRPHNYGQGLGTMQNPTVPTCLFWTWTALNFEM